MGNLEKATLTVEEARELLRISRGLIYDAIRRGEIPSIRIGRRILIPTSALQQLL
ncbi:helix-turn-helix domain-containing protein, partial [Chloroflexota bacterium]